MILPVIFIYFVIFFTQLLLLNTLKELNGLLCADVPLRNYSLTHSLTHPDLGLQSPGLELETKSLDLHNVTDGRTDRQMTSSCQ